MRMDRRLQKFLNVLALMAAIVLPRNSGAADLSGEWIGQITGPFDTPFTAQYSHVVLNVTGSKISGKWGQYAIAGSLASDDVTIELLDGSGKTIGTLTGTMKAGAVSGSGTVIPSRRMGSTVDPLPNDVTWNLMSSMPAPATPKTYDYDPKYFYGTYSAAEPPALHIFAGDTVRTRTYDGQGPDAHAIRHGTGGDVNTGPFYVEGALPGDTLVVHIVKLRANKLLGRQGSRFNQHAVTQAYALSAKYDPNFNGNWQQDIEKNVATLPPSPGLPHLTISMKTMLGCISVAPPGEEQYAGTDLGVFGGNLDYNDNVEGTTLYFPVFHPGALLGIGDAHGAMGDGEVVGTGLETSADVTFTVNVIRGYATPQVRAETKDYLISFGVSGSVPDSIQLATAQLADWLKHDYNLNDSEVALLLGDVMKYDITELVDPHFDVVAKVPKSVLATLNK